VHSELLMNVERRRAHNLMNVCYIQLWSTQNADYDALMASRDEAAELIPQQISQ
jgi:hypothetical protein